MSFSGARVTIVLATMSPNLSLSWDTEMIMAARMYTAGSQSTNRKRFLLNELANEHGSPLLSTTRNLSRVLPIVAANSPSCRK